MERGVTVVVPIYNEEFILEKSILTLHGFLEGRVTTPWTIQIADNASIDSSPEIGEKLCRELDGVDYLRLEEKGRGRALRRAWMGAKTEWVGYMDVDLSTGLEALPAALAALENAHMAIGSRLQPSSEVTRGAYRETLSRGYNMLTRFLLRTVVRDAQCGFKFIHTSCARHLAPLAENDGWFFDTEMLVLAQWAGYRIAEIPVKWIDDSDSRVHVPRTVAEDLRGIGRMLRQRRILKQAIEITRPGSIPHGTFAGEAGSTVDAGFLGR